MVLDNGLALGMRQAINWTNDDPIQWRIYARWGEMNQLSGPGKMILLSLFSHVFVWLTTMYVIATGNERRCVHNDRIGDTSTLGSDNKLSDNSREITNSLSAWSMWPVGTSLGGMGGCPKSLMKSSNGNIFRITGHRCIPLTKTSDTDVFFDLRLNKRLSQQSRHRLFETQSRSLWRHCNV